jgi:hypothetical protein
MHEFRHVNSVAQLCGPRTFVDVDNTTTLEFNQVRILATAPEVSQTGEIMVLDVLVYRPRSLTQYPPDLTDLRRFIRIPENMLHPSQQLSWQVQCANSPQLELRRWRGDSLQDPPVQVCNV